VDCISTDEDAKIATEIVRRLNKYDALIEGLRKIVETQTWDGCVVMAARLIEGETT
jgi:hypothetical protein